MSRRQLAKRFEVFETYRVSRKNLLPLETFSVTIFVIPIAMALVTSVN